MLLSVTVSQLEDLTVLHHLAHNAVERVGTFDAGSTLLVNVVLDVLLPLNFLILPRRPVNEAVLPVLEFLLAIFHFRLHRLAIYATVAHHQLTISRVDRDLCRIVQVPGSNARIVDVLRLARSRVAQRGFLPFLLFALENILRLSVAVFSLDARELVELLELLSDQLEAFKSNSLPLSAVPWRKGQLSESFLIRRRFVVLRVKIIEDCGSRIGLLFLYIVDTLFVLGIIIFSRFDLAGNFILLVEFSFVLFVSVGKSN